MSVLPQYFRKFGHIRAIFGSISYKILKKAGFIDETISI